MTNSDREQTDTERELLSFLALVVATMLPNLAGPARDRLLHLRRKMLRDAKLASDECLR